MTSTNIFKGFGGSEKNSSKVLKPPGGGHTDIFGAPDLPVKRDSGRNASSILEGTNPTNEKPTTPVKAPAPEQKAPVAAAQPAAAPARSRVPPGGFSSGPLW